MYEESFEKYNRLTIKTLSTIKNEYEEKKSIFNDEEKIKTTYNSFTLENDILNLIPNNYSSMISPLATYYSKKIPFKHRNHSVNISKKKEDKNKLCLKKNFSNRKGGKICFDNLTKSKEKSEEKYSISNLNFELFPNKKKENFIICDTENLSYEKLNKTKKFINEKINHFKKEEKSNKYEIIDNENNENINLMNINNYKEIETDSSQTKSNSKTNSHIPKINLETRNIKQIFLTEEDNNFSSFRKEKTIINQNQNFFRKMQFKSKIKLPNFSWIVNKENINCNSNNNYYKNMNNSKNNKKFKSKLIIKRNKNSLNKETQNNNYDIKLIQSSELYKLHRNNIYSDYKEKKTNKYFQQSEIYYKLTHINKNKPEIK